MNKNKVELIGYYGSDEIIACSAWTSTSRTLNEEKRNRVPKLIDMLWKEGHHTPFEKGMVHFLVDCDIASHIHLLKHRIASINAESARYKELKEDKFYIPEDWRGVKSSFISDKFGVTIDTYQQDWGSVLEEYVNLGNELYHKSLEQLEPVVGRKRAKESARFFKTYNSQIQADVTFNMRSFANFQKLRNSSHAQKEIREIAQEMIKLVENCEGEPFKYTIEAWKNHNVLNEKN